MNFIYELDPYPIMMYNQSAMYRRPRLSKVIVLHLHVYEHTGWPKNWHHFLYTLTLPNINRFSQFYLTILLPVPSNVITDVIGIWSVSFKSFLFIKNFVTIMRVGRLTSDVVLFSIVAFKTPNILQGSVATHLRCGGIFSNSIITNFLLILTVK